MSSTLTWYNSGVFTKSGTTIGALFTDIKGVVDGNSGNANFKWQVAGSNIGSTPYYILLSRKSGSAGRILIVAWSSGPAGNNTAILEGAPTTNQMYVAWFPSGNASTASNLTASSGTIAGDDTNCTKVAPGHTVAGAYAASFQPFYFDSDDGVFFGFQNPAAQTLYGFGAGDLVIDGSDAVYGAAIGYGSGGLGANSYGGATSPMPWVAAAVLSGAVTPCIRTNYGSSNRVYFHAYAPSGPWATTAVGTTDVMTKTSTNDAWFSPVQLTAQTVKGEGTPLKLRQMGFGPATLGAFTVYNETGPVVKALSFNAATAGATGGMWFLNKKL